MQMTEFLQFVGAIVIAGAIIVYAGWLLLRKIRKRSAKLADFREWIKNVFEAIWGLG